MIPPPTNRRLFKPLVLNNTTTSPTVNGLHCSSSTASTDRNSRLSLQTPPIANNSSNKISMLLSIGKPRSRHSLNSTTANVPASTFAAALTVQNISSVNTKNFAVNKQSTRRRMSADSVDSYKRFDDVDLNDADAEDSGLPSSSKSSATSGEQISPADTCLPLATESELKTSRNIPVKPHHTRSISRASSNGELLDNNNKPLSSLFTPNIVLTRRVSALNAELSTWIHQHQQDELEQSKPTVVPRRATSSSDSPINIRKHPHRRNIATSETDQQEIFLPAPVFSPDFGITGSADDSTPPSKGTFSTTAATTAKTTPDGGNLLLNSSSTTTTTTKTVSPRNNRWIAEQPISPLALPNNSIVSTASSLRPPSTSTKLASFSPVSDNNLQENGQNEQLSTSRIAVSPVRVLQPMKLKKPAPFAPPAPRSTSSTRPSHLQQQQSMDDYASEQQQEKLKMFAGSENVQNGGVGTTSSASLPVSSIEYRSSAVLKQQQPQQQFVTPTRAEWSNATGDIVVSKSSQPPHPTPPGDQHHSNEKTRTIPITIINAVGSSVNEQTEQLDTPSRRSSRNMSTSQNIVHTTPTPAPRSVSPYMMRNKNNSKSDGEILLDDRRQTTPLLTTVENRKSAAGRSDISNRAIPVQIVPDDEFTQQQIRRTNYLSGIECGKPTSCALCTSPSGELRDGGNVTHNHHQHLPVDESPTEPGYLLSQNEFEYRKSQAYHSFWRNLSGIYCIMLVVLGICLPIADSTAIKIKAKYYMVYYIYLYSVSIVFLLIMLVLLVTVRRRKSNTAANRLLGAAGHNGQWERDPLKKSNFDEQQDTMDINMLHKAAHTTSSGSIDNIPHTSMSSDHTGSFYLRLGAVLFGLLALILTCFELGQFFEHYVGDADPFPTPSSATATATDMPSLNRLDENVSTEVLLLSVLNVHVDRESCRQLTALLAPAANFLFIFIQTYFVFVNHKIRIDRCTTMVRFGLMHLVGTNLCIWLHVLVEETKHTMEHYAKEIVSGQPHFYSQRNFLNSSVANQIETADHDWFVRYIQREGQDRTPLVSTYCRNSTVMGRLQQSTTPFLFPFVVEYTLICAATLYVMWDQMGIDPIRKRYYDAFDLARILPARRRKHKEVEKISVDVTGVSRGCFVGLLFFVGTIISLVLFFVWVSLPSYEKLALMQVHIVEIAIYSVCIIAVIFAMRKMRRLKFDYNAGSGLGDLLLTVSQFGVYVLTCFTMICGFQMVFFMTEWHIQLLALVAVVLETVQTILQTLFLLDATRRRPAHESHVRLKPARELVTFLLVCNIGIWTVKSFESWRHQLHPVQIGFYGFWTWTLVTHICSPLMIFYRFHSSVLLSEVWKKAHKLKNK